MSEITPTSHYSSCSLPTPSMNLSFMYFFPTSKCETGITLARRCTHSQKCSLFLASSALTLQPVMWPRLRVGAAVGLLEELIHILSPSAPQWSSWQPAPLISEVSSLSRWRREERAPQTTTTSASTRYVEAGARGGGQDSCALKAPWALRQSLQKMNSFACRNADGRWLGCFPLSSDMKVKGVDESHSETLDVWALLLWQRRTGNPERLVKGDADTASLALRSRY